MPPRQTTARPVLYPPASDFGGGSVSEDGDSVPAAALIFAALGLCSEYYGPKTPVALECRTRGGTATLCGFDTFIPSSPGPQRKFRTMNFGGCTWLCRFNLGIPRVEITCYGNSCYYNAATCGFTQGFIANLQERYNSFDCSEPTPGVYDKFSACELFPAGSPPDCVQTNTLTRSTWTCNGVFVGNVSANTTPGTGIYKQLTDEDTEDDAIARLLAANPWSAFIEQTTCLSAWETRELTGDFEFYYQEAEFRVSTSGFPDGLYCYEFDVYRRPYGSSDPYEKFYTEQVTATATGGYFPAQPVPLDRGWEYYVTNANLFPNS